MQLTVQESRELLLNPAYQAQKTFEIQQRMANMYVQSTIVPQAYRGNIGNCVIAIDMAQRMQANPLMVMQNLYIVNGNPAWSSKFLISCINMSGRFTPLRYQFIGKRGTQQYGCRAYAYEKSDKEHKEALCSVWITMEMADKEGWTKKSGSKWLTMPDQMLIYRAAAFGLAPMLPKSLWDFLPRKKQRMPSLRKSWMHLLSHRHRATIFPNLQLPMLQPMKMQVQNKHQHSQPHNLLRPLLPQTPVKSLSMLSRLQCKSNSLHARRTTKHLRQ